MMLILLRYGLGFACGLFIFGYFLGLAKKQPLHKVVNAIATVLTVLIGASLIVSVQLVSAGDAALMGIQPASWASKVMTISHRVLATFVFILMLSMSIAGIRKRIQFHAKFALTFLIGYIVVYVSGLFLFTNV